MNKNKKIKEKREGLKVAQKTLLFLGFKMSLKPPRKAAKKANQKHLKKKNYAPVMKERAR